MLLLTSGTDSIGRHIVAACVRERKWVRVLYPLYDETAVAFVNQFSHTDFVEWQGVEVGGLREDYLWEGVERVIHTGIFTRHMQIVMDTEALLDKALEEKIDHFIYISTAGILVAEADQLYIDEGSNLLSAYGNDFVAMEREVWRAGAEGLSISILSPTYVCAALSEDALFFPTFVNDNKVACVHAKDIARVAQHLTLRAVACEKIILNAAYVPFSLWKQSHRKPLPTLTHQVPICNTRFHTLFPDFTYTPLF